MKLSYDSLVNVIFRNIAATTVGRIFAVSGKTIICSAVPFNGGTHLKRGGSILELFSKINYNLIFSYTNKHIRSKKHQ